MSYVSGSGQKCS